MKSLKWFQKNIGKRVFRDKSSCTCNGCADTVENGMIIVDEQHADYLYTAQNEYANENILLNYRAKK